MQPHPSLLIFGTLVMLTGGFAQDTPTLDIEPTLATSPVNFQADDPAIWIHPGNPDSSLIIGTDIGTYPNGGIFVWNLDGSQQQRIIISHPEQIDLRYGVSLAGASQDIAVVAMRDHNELRAYRVVPEKRMLEDMTTGSGIRVLSQPFGLGLHVRLSDGTLFATVSGRTASSREGVVQYRLDDDGSGFLQGTEVRNFGDNTGFVDGILVDDQLGYLYVAEEDSGVHKYYADPDRGDERLGFFAGVDEFEGNRGGMALYSCSDSTGYIFIANTANNAIRLYRREGDFRSPHEHTLIATLQNMFEEAGDGIDVTNFRASQTFPHGFLVWLNKTENNFQLYAWQDVAQGQLNICTQGEIPTAIGQSNGMLSEFGVAQNYPNPFNPETEIIFQVPVSERVTLSIHNLLGQPVKTLVDAALPPGIHKARWNGIDDLGRPAASGIYVYHLQASSYSETKRMVLLR